MTLRSSRSRLRLASLFASIAQSLVSKASRLCEGEMPDTQDELVKISETIGEYANRLDIAIGSRR